MKIHLLGLAAATLVALASPVAAQTSAQLPVKDATGSTRYLCETADGSGNLTGCLATGAATSALQQSMITALGNPMQTGGSVSISNTPTVNIGSIGGGATASAQGTGNASLASIAAYTKPVTSFAPITVGTAFTPGLGIAAVCTAAGNVVLAGSDASQITVPVGVGFNQFGFAVAKVVSQTATCTFTALS